MGMAAGVLEETAFRDAAVASFQAPAAPRSPRSDAEASGFGRAGPRGSDRGEVAGRAPRVGRDAGARGARSARGRGRQSVGTCRDTSAVDNPGKRASRGTVRNAPHRGRPRAARLILVLAARLHLGVEPGDGGGDVLRRGRGGRRSGRRPSRKSDPGIARGKATRRAPHLVIVVQVADVARLRRDRGERGGGEGGAQVRGARAHSARCDVDGRARVCLAAERRAPALHEPDPGGEPSRSPAVCSSARGAPAACRGT